jgi:transcriptional regulator with PAS, ATPase and Fis domain
MLNQIWDEYPYAVTVCDNDGVIIYMNLRSQETFAADGGKDLLGRKLYDCHSGKSQEKIKELLASGSSNTYTIEKKGVKKLIHQAPWFIKGKVAGLVEISIVLPENMPHFVRS